MYWSLAILQIKGVNHNFVVYKKKNFLVRFGFEILSICIWQQHETSNIVKKKKKIVKKMLNVLFTASNKFAFFQQISQWYNIDKMDI